MFENNRCLRYTTITPTSGIGTTTSLTNILPEGTNTATIGFNSTDNNLILSSDVIYITWNYVGSPSHNYSFCIFITAIDDTVQSGPPTVLYGITAFSNIIAICGITLSPVNRITLNKVSEN